MLKYLLLALFAAVQGGSPCPDQVVDIVPGSWVAGPAFQCDTGVTAQVLGVTVNSPQCPLFILVTPPHSDTKSQPGSNTYTQPAGLTAGKRLDYRCNSRSFLFFDLGSTCDKVGEFDAGFITHYQQFPCPVVMQVD